MFVCLCRELFAICSHRIKCSEAYSRDKYMLPEKSQAALDTINHFDFPNFFCRIIVLL